MTALTLLALLSAAPVVLEGDVPDKGAFFTIPFEVSAGVAELEVRHDDLSSSNILDWGLLAPDGGLVGWGGGNSEPAIVGSAASSRSYRLTELTPGTWRVLVGKALVTQQPAKYRVEVEARSTPLLAPQVRNGWTAPAPLEKGPRYFAGDLHVHSLESGDARASLADIAALARARGLDFVAISDHNTMTALDFMGDEQAKLNDFLFVPSIEFTTYAGHMNVFGAKAVPRFWFGLDNANFAGALSDFGAQGGVTTINHPTLDLGTFCIGCAWQQSAGGATAIEVGVGGWDETGSIFDESALAYWEKLASEGLHLTAVGGSDDHRAGQGLNQTQSAIGSPTVMIYADELSVEALQRGLRDGRTVVKLRGPDDPMIELGWPSSLTHSMGMLFSSEPVEVSARVTGGAGHVLAWIENGVTVATTPIPSNDFTATRTLSAPEGQSARLRAEVRLGGQPRTVTSHVWVGTDPFAPSVPPQKSSSCDSVGVLFPFAILALLRRRRC